MTDIIEKIGPWNVNKLALARKYEFKWDTVNRWYGNLLRNITPESVDNLQKMSEHALTRNLERCERILSDPSSSKNERLHAMRAVNETIKNLTEFLQEWGRKTKIADKLEHSGEVPIKIIAPDWWYKKDGDKSKSVQASPEAGNVSSK